MFRLLHACLLWVFFFLLGIQSTKSQTTALTSQAGFTINSDGSSSLGTVSLQSGADIRFGSAAPNYTIGEGHDILLGRSLGPDEAKLRVALKAPETLTASELAGTWQLYDYEIDETLDFDFATSSENITFSATSFTIDSSRRATIDLDGEITFAVNASKDFMVSTLSEGGIQTLIIAVRLESGGSTSQMAGTWNVGSFGVDFSEDPADRWYDGDTLTATAGGSVSLPDGSATWSANGSGSITFSDPEGSTTLSVNQSRSALAYTSTVGEVPDQGYEGAIVLRQAASPSIASLTGSWTLHTFELVDAPELDIIETYHPDGTTLASRERYTDGKLHGSPAIEQWDENGLLILVENYTEGVRAYRLEKSYNGELLSYTIETTYDGETRTSEESIYYHMDGVTVAQHITEILTEGGRRIVEDVFTAEGIQTSHYEYLDGKKHGVRQDWSADGKQTSEEIYDQGVLKTRITWLYHDNGRVNTRRVLDYTSGFEESLTTIWRADGTRDLVSRRRNSKSYGIQERYDTGGNLVEEYEFKNGIQDGVFRQWFDGGSQLQTEYTYKEGEIDGDFKHWYEDGRLQLDAFYIEGLEHGEWRSYQYDLSEGWRSEDREVWEYGESRERESWYWDASGILRDHWFDISEAGDLVGWPNATPDYRLREAFDDLGRPQRYSQYRNGDLDGVQRNWNEGILVSEDYYRQGLQNGRSRRWDYETGKLQLDAYYEDGLLHGTYKTYQEGKLWVTGEYVKGQREGLFITYSYSELNVLISQTEANYANDLLNGIWRQYQEGELQTSGEYKNDLQDGTWSQYNIDGKLVSKIDYSEGSPHGVSEYFHSSDESVTSRQHVTDGIIDGVEEGFSNGVRNSRTVWEFGEEVGPRETFYTNGQRSRIEPLVGGLVEGLVTNYRDNGQISSTITYKSGLRHGAYTDRDSNNRLSSTGSYNQGQQCGTWTFRSYDGEGILTDTETTDFGSCEPTGPFPISRGIKGYVSSGGVGIPGVSIQLGEIANTSTGKDGGYFLEIGEASASKLTLTHPNFQDKTIDPFNLPAPYTYETRNFTLNEHTTPPLALGDPSMSGTYFLRGIPFQVNYRDLEVPGNNEDGRPDLYWQKPGQEPALANRHGFTLNPGIDADDSGNAGSIFTRSTRGLESTPISLPTYNISKSPAWAEKLGGWETHWEGYENQPGLYRLIRRWPTDGPIDFGIKRETATPEEWAFWQVVPIIGGEDFGLFDTFIDINAFAWTDGSPGSVELEASGDLRFGLSLPALPVGLALKSRLNAEGSGTLNWRDTLSLDSASIKLSKASEGKIIFKPTTLFEKYGINFDWLKPLGTFGLQFTELINVIEFEVSYGESFEGDISLYAGKDSLEILTASAEKRASLAAELDSYLKELEIGIKGEAFVNVTYTDSLASSLAFGSTIEVNGRVVVDDIALFSFTIPEEPEPSSTLGSQSTKPQFVPASYSGMNDYARFDPKDRIETLSSNATTTAEPDELPLVSNVYPHAEPTVAEFGGTKAIAYIHFDSTRPEGRSTRLYYSIDSGNGFGTPKAVHDQARSDFDPQIAYLPDGRLLALWKTSHLDQISPTLNERLAGSEIAWSIYDSSSDIWSEPTLITNNAHIDHRPSIASSAGGLMAVWHSNEANAYIPDYDYPDTVNFARWNGSAFDNPSTLPFELPTMGSVSAAYDGSNASLAWIQDIDGDFATTEDIELFRAQFDGDSWSDPERLTNDSLIDARPALLCSNEGGFETVWLKNGRLVRLASEESLTYENVFASIQADGSTNYSVSCTDDGNIALVWSEYVGTQNDLLFSYFDSLSAQWSEPVQLTDNFELERASAFTLDNNGKLLAAYLSEHTDSEQRDLRWLECEIGRDLTIESVTIAPIEDSPGQFNISASVANLGALPSGSTKVDFHNGDPDNGGIYLGELVVNLKGGENTDVLYQTGVLAEGTIYARIDPDNTVEELDESNNTASSNLNPVDLEANYLTWDRSVSDESTLTLKGTIANNGRTAQTNIPITIRDASGPLFTTTVTSLEPGESTSVETTLVAPSENKYRYTLVVDPDNTLNEPDRSDNEFPLIVTLARLKDSDGDGMENAWEELNFGTLERDGSGDFDGDGLTDAFEFITQNDPLDPKSKYPFTIEPHPTDASKVLIRFPSIAARVYRIQRSSDFSNWTNDSFHLGTGEIISVATDATDPSNGFRIQIGLQ